MKRILLIDDEQNFTIGVKSNLEATGDYQVEIVNDPRESLATAKAVRPDLVLLDIVMPEMDGGDVVKLFEKDPDLRDIPILVVTAMIHREAAGEGMIETGDFSMLAKPVKAAVLIESIEKKLAEAAGETTSD